MYNVYKNSENHTILSIKPQQRAKLFYFMLSFRAFLFLPGLLLPPSTFPFIRIIYDRQELYEIEENNDESSIGAVWISISVKCIRCRIYGFQKKCDLVTHLVTYLVTDKVIHKGAPILVCFCTFQIILAILHLHFVTKLVS